MTETPQEAVSNGEDLAEGYPTTAEVLRAALQSEKLPDSGIRRLELNCFADGSATVRVFMVGVEEPEGDFLPGP